MPKLVRGDIWLVDLGMAAMVWRCLLVTDFPNDDELASLRLSLIQQQSEEPFGRSLFLIPT